MKIIGGNRFALDGKDGEEITVTVEAVGTAHLVTYIIKGAQPVGVPNEGNMVEGVPLRFRLSNLAGGPNILRLGFAFASPEEAAGGAVPDTVEYDVEITSKVPDSDVSREFISGAFGIPSDGRRWRFS